VNISDNFNAFIVLFNYFVNAIVMLLHALPESFLCLVYYFEYLSILYPLFCSCPFATLLISFHSTFVWGQGWFTALLRHFAWLKAFLVKLLAYLMEVPQRAIVFKFGIVFIITMLKSFRCNQVNIFFDSRLRFLKFLNCQWAAMVTVCFIFWLSRGRLPGLRKILNARLSELFLLSLKVFTFWVTL
jgi:hypothetical protein